MTTVPTTLMQIPCCLCGTMIVPNAANQCSSCLAQQFDLKSVLQGKNGDMIVVKQCRQCRKFARTETYWEHAEPESPQLLSLCLKHIPALKQGNHGTNSHYHLHLIDAIWVWTEPHSMRLKLRVTVRAEIENVPVQQRVLVEFQIKFHQCPDCNREYTNRTWQALVQLRQKRDDGSPRKGLAALEMALARNSDIRKHVLRIDSCRHGLDFYFLSYPNAQQFGHFLARLAPMRTKTTQKIVSEDVKNNTANLKQTLACDMVPMCRHDLIVVHKGTGNSKLSGRLCLVIKVSSVIHLIDASPKRTIDDTLDQYRTELSADAYYKAGGDKVFPVLQTAERLVRFVVLDTELIGGNPASSSTVAATADSDGPKLYQGPTSGIEKYALADVQVARESDLGSNDTIYHCVTHLGNLLQPGDVVLGYDLVATASTLSTIHASLGVVDVEDVLHSNFVRPDVVLVKKVTESSSNKKGNNTDTTDVADHVAAGGGDNDDDPKLSGGPKKKMTKKKERRMKKQDKRRRELAETAARMGFLDDDGFGGGDEEDHDDNGRRAGGGGTQTSSMWDAPPASNDFSTQLANDPELAADLQFVEQELSTMELKTQTTTTTTTTPTSTTEKDDIGKEEADKGATNETLAVPSSMEKE